MPRPFRTRRNLKWAGVGLCMVILAVWGVSLRHWTVTRVGSHGYIWLNPGYVQLGVAGSTATWPGLYSGTLGGSIIDNVKRSGFSLPSLRFFTVTPSADTALNLPFWLLLVGAGLPTGVLYYRDRSSRILPGHCPRCGYDLTGNASGKCSECGAAISSSSAAHAGP